MAEPAMNTPPTPVVLVVDDEKELRSLMVKDVEFFGFRTLDAGSVQEARQLIEGGGIQIVVTDLKMPGETGADLVRWLHTRGKAPKIIVYSGLVDRTLRRELMEQGVIAILEKPYSEDELEAALKIAAAS